MIFSLVSHHRPGRLRPPFVRLETRISILVTTFAFTRRSFLPISSFLRFPDSLDSSCGLSVPLFLEAAAVAVQDTVDRMKEGPARRRSQLRQ